MKVFEMGIIQAKKNINKGGYDGIDKKRLLEGVWAGFSGPSFKPT